MWYCAVGLDPGVDIDDFIDPIVILIRYLPNVDIIRFRISAILECLIGHPQFPPSTERKMTGSIQSHLIL